MRLKFPLAVYFSPLALAVAALAVCSFAGPSAKAQSSQPPFPARLQRPDQTKPLEDKTVSAAPQQQPTAAEMSKKETVASAFLRGRHRCPNVATAPSARGRTLRQWRATR